MELSYKLCKGLKDAGFPQNTYFHWVKYKDKEPSLYDATMMSDYIGTIKPIEIIGSPTLLELVEACGDIWIKLFIKGKKKAGVQLEEESLDDIKWYLTPEEAVARLYLRKK